MNRFFATPPPLKFEEKKENRLGEGGYGVVYRGTFKGNNVAVKVIVKVHSDDERKKEQKREMEEHPRLDHENVLKLLHVDGSRNKTCLVLELCAGTLSDYCDKGNTRKYKGPKLPPDGIVLYQIANGLHYIHSQNLVHRDVKPDNILISMTTPVQMKLSDFGYVKKTSPRGTYTQSGLKGTPNWMAPEILELLNENSSRDSTSEEIPHGSIQSDIFAAGCVFFYFLTRGKHPFGSKSFEIPVNILKDNPIELNQQKNIILQVDERALYELIGKMIKRMVGRISLPEVIEQLLTAAKLDASRQFKKSERLMSGKGRCVTRFHPAEPVLACTGVDDDIILFSAENSSIPFQNWKRKETQLQPGNFVKATTIEWNVNGTQMVAIASNECDIIVCWSYPSGAILFQKKLNEPMTRIEWNPFRPNVFATFGGFGSEKIVFFFNSCPVDQRPFHFCTIESGRGILSFQWISENRVALGLMEGGRIEIWEIIDELTVTAKVVKELKHEGVTGLIFDMAWDGRTKYLAACSSRWMTIWSMDSVKPIHSLQMEGVKCWRLAWRPNGKQTDDEGVDAARKSADNFILACGLIDGRIVIWTPLDSKEKTRILSQHSNFIESLWFSPDGRFLASADTDGKWIIWATENWEPVHIDEEKSVDRFSWLSSSTDVPDYKLTFNSSGDKVVVVEHINGQCEIPSKD